MVSLPGLGLPFIYVVCYAHVHCTCACICIMYITAFLIAGEVCVALQSSQHQQTAPQAHRQPHPLHIVHKMSHQVGAGMATSVPTSQQQTVGGDISRNQRHQKLPPGQGKSQGEHTLEHDVIKIIMS